MRMVLPVFELSIVRTRPIGSPQRLQLRIGTGVCDGGEESSLF